MIALGVLLVVAAGLVLAFGGSLGHPGARRIPGWALQWPDHRNRSVPPGVLDRAVLAWWYGTTFSAPLGDAETVPAKGTSARTVASLAAARHVVWYVGQTIDRGGVAVVMFEAPTPGGPRLVTGWATASQVMSDQPAYSAAASPWVFTTVPAPSPRSRALAIGMYAHGGASAPGQSPDNWMVVLTAPAARRISWTATAATGARKVSSALRQGLVVADTGQVTAPVELTAIWTPTGNVLGRTLAVGLPGAAPAVPQLAQAPALTLPGSFSLADGFGGQGAEFDDLGVPATTGRRMVVLGACYGPQPLRVRVNGRSIGEIPCDLEQHQLDVPVALGRHQVMLDISASNLSAWQLAVGSEPDRR